MDIIIKSGFLKIDGVFRGSSLKKGRLLVESGHVGSVEECLGTIRGKVLRQTSVNLPPYNVQLDLDINRHIRTATCNCVAGEGGCCKHIAAVFYFVNSEEGPSKTSEPQQWGKISMKKKYAKPVPVCELFPKPQSSCKFRKELKPINLNSLPPCPFKDIVMSELKSSGETLVEKCINSRPMMSKAVNIQSKSELVGILDHIYSRSKRSYFTKISSYFDDLVEFEQIVYFNDILVSYDRARDICVETLPQNKSNIWFKERAKRITASTAHRVACRRQINQTFAHKFFQQQRQQITSAALEYGRKTEKKAVLEYISVTNNVVVNLGVVVHPEQNWLCGSPDGVVVDYDKKPTKVLEVKCPYSCRNAGMVNEDGSVNIPYIKKINEQYILNKNCTYYTQVQLLMYVLGLDNTDLFIYTNKQFLLINVKINNLYLEKIVNRLEEFYFCFLLPEIVESQKKPM